MKDYDDIIPYLISKGFSNYNYVDSNGFTALLYGN